jgi:hypothetical protein
MSDQHKDTFFSRAIADPDEAGGRYAKLNPAKVTGSTPTQWCRNSPLTVLGPVMQRRLSHQ